ncbi:OmpA family protein [Luteimonas sp. SJ-92]|uniref:OmpA family protein n=1 Tax=Luteimonas salinisoli TaxID=2752307 RepID=A0A853J858_9GAMM|nr:OmpA family protein [Luteimonas salinisoli]NZA25055.1 OmpA family protein [Luteimonas salinisoli]
MPCQRFLPRLCLAVLALSLSATVSAQTLADRLKRTVERAATSEVERKVDQETRRVTRCALGDERCVREAERRGDRVEIVGGGAAQAGASADPGGDHPLIAPYAGSNLRERKYDAYNEYQRIVGFAQRQNRTERLEGRLTRLRYDNPRGRSTFEIERNYRDALAARGFRVDYECQRRDACGSIANPGWNTINGMNVGIAGDLRYFTGRLAYGDGNAYVSVAVNPHITYVHVLETAGMDTGMVGVSADALAAGLAQDGKVTLDGIFFDTGRATLKPESNPSLDQAAQLLNQQASLKLLVVGHTDGTGSAASNMTLSQQRADAVRNALLARGIAAARLAAQGVGSTVPVASNDTEAGRAQNRRVELVKQ